MIYYLRFGTGVTNTSAAMAISDLIVRRLPLPSPSCSRDPTAQ